MGKSTHLGSHFDDFLRDENTLAEVEAAAAKRVIAFQVEEMMKKKQLTKTELADKMHTSRAALDRLLDASNTSVTLLTLERAVLAVGKKLKIQLV